MIIGKTFKTQQVWGAQSPLRGMTGAGLKTLSGLSSSHTVIPKTGEAGMERTDHIKEADVLHAALFIQQTCSLLERLWEGGGACSHGARRSRGPPRAKMKAEGSK